MRLQREDGVVAVEFAIVLPILLLILLGIIEFGFVLYNQQIITNASREGARAGIVLAVPRPSEAAIQSVVNTYLTGAGLHTLSADKIVVTREGLAFGNDLKVTVNYPYNFLFLPSFTGGSASITLHAITTMKNE